MLHHKFKRKKDEREKETNRSASKSRMELYSVFFMCISVALWRGKENFHEKVSFLFALIFHLIFLSFS